MLDLFFDTETSGFMNKKLHYADKNNAWVVQLAMILSNRDRIYGEFSAIIKANGRKIHPNAQETHGISVEDSEKGMAESEALNIFLSLYMYQDVQFICHNYAFDIKFLQGLLYRMGHALDADRLLKVPCICTMKKTTDFMQLPFPSGKTWGAQKYKWPKLEELHQKLFGESFEGAHDALADVRATRRCYYELIDRGIIIAN